MSELIRSFNIALPLTYIGSMLVTLIMVFPNSVGFELQKARIQCYWFPS